MSVSGGDGLERAASECALQYPPSWRISEGPSFLPFVLFLKAKPAKDDYYRYTKMHHASERGNSYIYVHQQRPQPHHHRVQVLRVCAMSYTSAPMVK
jgi:hypothetical protein